MTGLALFSAQFHDTVFAVGSLILFLAMLPACWRRAVLPLSTCVITGAVLFVFVLNFASMNYPYALVVEAGNVVCWVFLACVGQRARRVPTDSRPHARGRADIRQGDV